jgi:hypothetical protein
MYANIGWLALLGASFLIEVLARFRSTRTPTLAQLGAALATRVPGRVILLLLWLFVGLHLFARYTFPRH